jgi:hypothetical protein
VKVHPLFALLLLPLVPVTERVAERHVGRGRSAEVLYLWSGPQVRRLADGFANILADVYWLRTVQYFGSQRAFAERSNFALLRPLIDITTSLDPRMEIAYRYGATFLAEEYPAGAGDPQAAIDVLRKAVAQIDGTTASQILLEAAKLKDAPHILETLAADVVARRGDRQTARALWQRLYDQAEPGPMRDNAASHLQQLAALDGMDAIRAATEAFRARAGRWPASFDELRRAGLIQGNLVDPTGVPFEYNPETGQPSIGRSSRLWRRDLAR